MANDNDVDRMLDELVKGKPPEELLFESFRRELDSSGHGTAGRLPLS